MRKAVFDKPQKQGFWKMVCSFPVNLLMHSFPDLSPNIKLQLTPYMIIFVRTTSIQTAANPLQLMISVRKKAREMIPSLCYRE